MSPPTESYELLYFQTWILSDIVLMLLEIGEADYTHVIPDWPAIKEEQKFGKLPCLTIKRPDGTAHKLWESSSIEFYLAEKFGLIPQDLFEKAECLSIIGSLNEAREYVSGVQYVFNLPVEQRQSTYEKHRTESIPRFLKYHESLLEKTEGPFYRGDKVSLPDLVLLALFSRLGNIYGELNPINVKAFPRVMDSINASLAIPKIGAYVKERRDAGVYGWQKENMTYGPLQK